MISQLISWFRASVLLLLLPASAVGQSLTLTLDAGRVYNLPLGGYVPGCAAGLEVEKGPVLFSAQTFVDGRSGKVFEQDFNLLVERAVGKQLTVNLQASYFKFFPRWWGHDWAATVGLRWRIR